MPTSSFDQIKTQTIHQWVWCLAERSHTPFVCFHSVKNHPWLIEKNQRDRISVEHSHRFWKLVLNLWPVCRLVSSYIHPHSEPPGHPPVSSHDIIPRNSGSYYHVHGPLLPPRGVSPSLFAQPTLPPWCLLCQPATSLPRQPLWPMTPVKGLRSEE